MKQTKTIEQLTKAKVKFEVLSFEAKEFTAQEVCEKLSLPPEKVFKTLVLENDKKEYAMAVVPTPHELSLKKVSTAWGCKKCELTSVSDLQRLTGYLKGGCSPLGAKRTLPVFIDNSAESLDFIIVSAGLRGLQIKLAPQDLATQANAKFAELV